MKKYITAIALCSFFFLPSVAHAQSGIGCGGGLGPIAEALCGVSKGNEAEVGSRLDSLISAVIGVLTIVGALWFLFQIILAGYDWINAGGDKTRTEAAWHKITNASIGLTVVVAAWVIVGLFGKIIGVEILNPGKIIQTIGL